MKLYHASVNFLGNRVVLHPRVPKMKALKSEDDNTKEFHCQVMKLKLV